MKKKWIIVGGLSTSIVVVSLLCAQLSNQKGWLKNKLPILKPEERPQSGLTCARVPHLMQVFLLKHVAWKSWDKELQERTLKQYIKWIDGSKTLLLASDVTKIKADLGKMFERMSLGDCGALERTRNILVERSKENEKFVEGAMGPKYKFNENVEFVSDPDKRDFFKTSSKKFEYLEKFLHFQYSNYLMADTAPKEAKKLIIKKYVAITKRIQEEKFDEILAEFVNAFAYALDPHSSYLSPNELADFNIQMNLELEGIGATLTSQDGYTVVEELVKGGAADRAGELETKDKIVAVAQDKEPPVSVIDMDLKDVVRLIRGKKGTKVNLTVMRKKGTETQQHKIVIVRDKISLEDQAAQISYYDRKVDGKDKKFAVIDFPSFYGSTDPRDAAKRSSYRDMKRLVSEAAKKKVDGIVINLIQNGGGLLEGARTISGLFIEKGSIVATKDSEGRILPLEDDDASVSYAGPLVLLVSRLTASAAEIMAGALKSYHRALVVGSDHTFGKGTVQQVEQLPFGLGASKITTALFFVPNGETTQHQGVASDVEIPTLWSLDELGEKSADYSLPPQKIVPFIGKEANKTHLWKPITEKIIDKVKEKSKSRVAKSEKFKEILSELKEAQKNKGVVKLADFRKRAQEDKAKDDKKKNQPSSERKKEIMAPYIDEGLNVLSDLSVELNKAS
ncbi:MAG: S41 family peptidase [Bdellovibrionota bacterium]